jgi:hypothetical protein
MVAVPVHADLLTIPGSGVVGSDPPLPPNTLWYNGDANGNNAAVNQDNSVYDQTIYNDFNVTGAGWNVQSVWSNDIFVSGPPASTTATWQIRSNMPTGTLVAGGDAAATLTPTGFTVGGHIEYMVEVSGLNVLLAPGTYWLAVYADKTNGGMEYNDITSGANAVGTPPGNNGNLYASVDHNSTFFAATDPLDTSAGVAGVAAVPEVSSLTLLGTLVCLIMFLGRFRRKRSANLRTL